MITAYHKLEAGVDQIRAINEFATRGLRPDRTLLLDVEPEIGRARSRAREEPVDRLEAEQDEFFERIHATYGELANAEPERIRKIDAGGPPEQVLGAALDALADLL